MSQPPLLFAGRSNPALASAIGRVLSTRLRRTVPVPVIVKPFNDGEPNVQVASNVRGRDVFLVQSTQQPGDHLVELLAMADAATRASAASITAVMPYFGYARQDRKVRPRVPITAAAVCTALRAVGVHRILTTDLHAGQIQGFFPGPFDNLEALPLVLAQIRKDFRIAFADVAFVSPDDGGLERCRETGKVVGCDRVTFVVKHRDRTNLGTTSYGVRDPELVEGRTCLLVDDLVDSAGTLAGAATALADAGAARIIAVAVHGVLSKDQKTGVHALDRVEQSPIESLYITDTIPVAARHPKLRVVSVAGLLARAILEVHRNGSVSSIFREVARRLRT